MRGVRWRGCSEKSKRKREKNFLQPRHEFPLSIYRQDPPKTLAPNQFCPRPLPTPANTSLLKTIPPLPSLFLFSSQNTPHTTTCHLDGEFLRKIRGGHTCFSSFFGSLPHFFLRRSRPRTPCPASARPSLAPSVPCPDRISSASANQSEIGSVPVFPLNSQFTDAARRPSGRVQRLMILSCARRTVKPARTPCPLGSLETFRL